MNVNACVPLNVPRNRPTQQETNDTSRPLVKDDASQDRASSQREDKASDGAR